MIVEFLFYKWVLFSFRSPALVGSSSFPLFPENFFWGRVRGSVHGVVAAGISDFEDPFVGSFVSNDESFHTYAFSLTRFHVFCTMIFC
jgi:hypothetical protein